MKKGTHLLEWVLFCASCTSLPVLFLLIHVKLQYYVLQGIYVLPNFAAEIKKTKLFNHYSYEC